MRSERTLATSQRSPTRSLIWLPTCPPIAMLGSGSSARLPTMPASSRTCELDPAISMTWPIWIAPPAGAAVAVSKACELLKSFIPIPLPACARG